MKLRFWESPSIYDEPIAKALVEMEQYGLETKEYQTALQYFERLTRMRAEEAPRRVSPDTILIVVGNLAGILIIVAYERMHVMTSKAFGYFQKTK